MANTIAYAKAYINMLDSIYKEGSVTSILEANANMFRQGNNANSVLIKKFTSDGLGDYSRSTGYVAGDVTISWEEFTFAIDRARKYNLDTMDALEAQSTAAELMAEIMRTQVVPEVDAYRFAKIFSLAGSDAQATLTYDTAIAAIDTAVAAMNNNQVPMANRILFVSNEMYSAMKASGELFNVRLGSGIVDRNIVTFDGMPLVVVPSSLFKSAFTLLDGTSQGETAGGFTPAQAAKDINFMIVYKPAVIAIVKHVAPKFIAPENNPDNDGFLFATRLYHDLFIPDNKINGIYIHNRA